MHNHVKAHAFYIPLYLYIQSNRLANGFFLSSVCVSVQSSNQQPTIAGRDISKSYFIYHCQSSHNFIYLDCSIPASIASRFDCRTNCYGMT